MADRATARQRGGFTLVELMVVVLMIGVLLAVAVPTFLGTRRRADDRSAQSSLRLALSAARVKYLDGRSFTGAEWETLPAVEPSVTYRKPHEESTGSKEVSVKAISSDTWFGAVRSRSGNCYFIQDKADGAGTSFASSDSAGVPCTGQQATLLDAAEWRSRW